MNFKRPFFASILVCVISLNTLNALEFQTIYFGEGFLPCNDCNSITNSNFTGYEYYVVQNAISYMNLTNYNLTCITQESFYGLLYGKIYFYSWTVNTYAVDFFGFRFTQPTIDTGITIISRFNRSPWLFLKGITVTDILIVLAIFPFLAGVTLWISEKHSYRVLEFFFEIIVSYFYMNEIHLKNASSKTIKIIMFIIALIFITIYNGILIENYHENKTFNGLLDDGGLFGKKIPSSIPLSFVATSGILPFPTYVAWTTKELEELFNNGTINLYLSDDLFVTNFAGGSCDIYVVLPNIIKMFYAGAFFNEFTANVDRQFWNEGIVRSRENLSEKKIQALYNSDPLSTNLTPCKKKKNLHFSTYVLDDFYELWFIYIVGLGLAVLSKISFFLYAKCSNSKRNFRIQKIIIQHKIQNKLCQRIKSFFENYFLANMIIIRLYKKEVIDRVVKKNIYQRIKSKVSSTKKKIYANACTAVTKINKEKMQEIQRDAILRNNKKKKSAKNYFSFTQKGTSQKTKNNEFLCLSLAFDSLLKELFTHSLTTLECNFVRYNDTDSDHVNIILSFLNNRSLYMTHANFLSTQNICKNIVQKYFKSIYRKLDLLGKTKRQKICKYIDMLISNLIVNQEKFSFYATMILLKKELNSQINKSVEKKTHYNIYKNLSSTININKGKSVQEFQKLGLFDKKSIYMCLRKTRLENLKVCAKNKKLILDIPENFGQIIYKLPQISTHKLNEANIYQTLQKK